MGFICPRSSVDRAPASGAGGAGSSPAGGTTALPIAAGRHLASDKGRRRDPAYLRTRKACMSYDRRRQQQRERQRRRRNERPMTVTSAGSDVAMPGVFGWMQRNGRLLVLVGILVMVVSLGGTF